MHLVVWHTSSSPRGPCSHACYVTNNQDRDPGNAISTLLWNSLEAIYIYRALCSQFFLQSRVANHCQPGFFEISGIDFATDNGVCSNHRPPRISVMHLYRVRSSETRARANKTAREPPIPTSMVAERIFHGGLIHAEGHEGL